MLDPKLTNQPINYLDPEKLGILMCGAVAVVATVVRVRTMLRKRAEGGGAKDLSHWDAPSPTEWAEG